ncbi:MAG: efflux RND transporter permease subunit, partial [Alphaproteobacteria bacterium]|nr:efflux RND transporter permease subunit [Alphaproteobacteria bacterium]
MNRFIAAFVGRSRTVLTAMIVVFFAGVASFLALPREADPDIDIPIFFISIAFPGISPEDSERLIVQPMEKELRSLEGLKEMRSTASQHHAGIVLQFEVDFDKDAVLANIRNKVSQAQAEIPEGTEEPEIFEFNTALFPVLIVTIAGDVPERTLFTYTKRLQDLIETIPNVLEAKMQGHREELLEIVVDPDKMAAYNIQYHQLVSKVSRNNLMVAAGSLNSGQGEFSIKLPGLVETAQDLFNIPLLGDEKGGLVLSDIADIRRTFKDQSQLVRVNGQPALTIEIVKRLGANIVETTRTVRAFVEEARKHVPENIKVGFALDQSTVVDRALSSLRNSVLTAVLLVMILVVATLGVRSGSLVGFAIPISFMMTFFFLALSGFTI